MSNNRLLALAAAVVGVILMVIAIVYFVEPAKSLPSFFPGHQAGSTHHHVKHGIAALRARSRRVRVRVVPDRPAQGRGGGARELGAQVAGRAS